MEHVSSPEKAYLSRTVGFSPGEPIGIVHKRPLPCYKCKLQANSRSGAEIADYGLAGRTADYVEKAADGVVQ
jgi:hypothetical protein